LQFKNNCRKKKYDTQLALLLEVLNCSLSVGSTQLAYSGLKYRAQPKMAHAHNGAKTKWCKDKMAQTFA
jgi:hypothetical protein